MPLADRLNPNQATALRVGFGEHPAGERNDRFLVYSATLGLIAEAAGTQPVLCVVDDAHWLDEESANALLFTARRVGVERVAMLFAARDQEEAHFEATGVPTLSVPGLSSGAAHALLEESAGHPVDPRVTEALLEATDGKPAGPRGAAGGAHRRGAVRRGAAAPLAAGDRPREARVPRPGPPPACRRPDVPVGRGC